MVAATATAMLGANILSRRLEDNGRISDMLLLAEPLQGAALGAMLLGVWLCTIG
jgi:hypothetical protein